jgi:hypothetical protein
MAIKNQALTVCYVAWNTSTNSGQTGDSANHTLKLVQDGTEANPTNSPSQVDATNLPGVYKLALTAADVNFNCIVLAGKSSTANVVIIPLVIITERGNVNTAAAPGAAGGLFVAGTNAATTVTTALTTTFAGNLTGSAASVTGAVGSVTGNVGGNVTGSVGSVVSAPFKVNQAAGFEFAMVQSSDHATGYTGGSVSGVRSIAGGSESAISGTVTQIASTNRYYFSGLAADFNGTSVGFVFSATGADNVVINVNTQP